ncbi:MAG: ribonuclease III [Candidatus Sungbacteria bacterium RIFCSPLOWO2_01_FULL_60_25]|uniref:Ribonuclease 3 n=1 Tax=Candidatus Sungbacteria bacterium RIFCSPLOWO2_01_FULL_60_25 TaxID=1802281 RepID=A0A1G2LAZ7_9BACT|nr:MAG: ribonuclease III [Candidatus Sungbacteria bacterium RIFCSPLOWO2_01_FULL_60_25]
MLSRFASESPVDRTRLETIIGISFQNPDLLEQAFVHRSYLNENPGFRLPHNERLEFLGDAVLELVITEILYERFPEKPEGELTSLRAALVNANMLAAVGQEIGLNEFLLLSRGEAKDTGRARQYILANTFEALVGAIYLDQGYSAAHGFVTRVLVPRLAQVLDEKLYRDPKSLFQEAAQERVGITPSYEVLRESGPDHDKKFVVGVCLGRELVSEGEGPSKQAAEVEAARRAILARGWG